MSRPGFSGWSGGGGQRHACTGGCYAGRRAAQETSRAHVKRCEQESGVRLWVSGGAAAALRRGDPGREVHQDAHPVLHAAPCSRRRGDQTASRHRGQLRPAAEHDPRVHGPRPLPPRPPQPRALGPARPLPPRLRSRLRQLRRAVLHRRRRGQSLPEPRGSPTLCRLGGGWLRWEG